MAFFYYLRPDLIVNTLTTAPSVSGPAEDGYDPHWLVDGQAGRPIRSPGNDATWTIDHNATEVNFIGIANHNIDKGRNIILSGDFTANFDSPGPLKNPFFIFPLENTFNSLTVTVQNNSPGHVTIGELVIGRALELERPIIPGGRRQFIHKNEDRGGLYHSMTSYDYGVRARTLTASTTCTQAGLDAIEEWYDSCRDQALFTAIVPTPSIADFMLATFKLFDYAKRGPQWFDVNFQFEETRVKW